MGTVPCMVIALIYAACLSLLSAVLGSFYERCRWIAVTERLLYLLDDREL